VRTCHGMSLQFTSFYAYGHAMACPDQYYVIAQCYHHKKMKNLVLFIFLLFGVCGYSQTAEQYLQMAKDSLEAGNGSSAIENAHHALDLRPCYIEALWFMGDLWLRAKNYSEVLAYYEDAVACEPENKEAIRKRDDIKNKINGMGK
jgi:tetratricopeptide (TPR) repeat protein